MFIDILWKFTVQKKYDLKGRIFCCSIHFSIPFLFENLLKIRYSTTPRTKYFLWRVPLNSVFWSTLPVDFWENLFSNKTLWFPFELEAGTFKSFLKSSWKITNMWKSRMAEMADSLLTLFKHAQNQSRKGKPPNMWMISHLNKLCGSQGPFFLCRPIHFSIPFLFEDLEEKYIQLPHKPNTLFRGPP